MNEQSPDAGDNLDVLAVMRPLTHDERMEAHSKAAQALAGDKPRHEQFENSSASDYPGWVTWVIGLMLLAAFVGAFMTSAFSVYSAGRNHYLDAMDGAAGVGWQAVIVGGAIVLLSEFLTITSVLAGRIYFRDRRLWQAAMLLPAVAGVVIAVTANAVIARPAGWWEWLVTVAPPVSVIFLSIIGEQIILADIETRRANRAAYEAEVQAWRCKLDNPVDSDQWTKYYWIALRDKLYSVQRTKAAKAMRGGLSTDQWVTLVQRELDAEAALLEIQARIADQEARRKQVSTVDRKQQRQQTPRKQVSNGQVSTGAVNRVSTNGVNKVSNGQQFTVDSLQDKRQLVIDHYRANPADLDAGLRPVAKKLGVSHAYVGTVRSQILDGEINLSD